MINEFPSSADYTALGFTYKKNWLKWHKAVNETDVKMVQDVSTGMYQKESERIRICSNVSEVQWNKWSLDKDRCWLGQDVNIVEIIILYPAMHLIWIKFN